MKTLLTTTLILTGMMTTSHAQVHVNGYYRSNGTYVQPAMRSAPDSSRFNNYSTQGNSNPYTGQPGTVNPYRESNAGSSYNSIQPSSGNSSYGMGTRRQLHSW